MILFNFDVLAKPSETLGQRQPDPEGRYLWSLLHEREMGRICIIVNQDYERELFEGWLKKEGVKAASYEFILFDDPILKAERIHTVAAVWGKAKWYVDNDPRVCAETLKRGIPTIVAVSPYVVRPEWDGGRMVKSWESLVDEIDTQALKAANRTWGDV
jgi:hypothetical protein